MPDVASIGIVVVAVLLVLVIVLSAVLPRVAGGSVKRASRRRMSEAVTDGSDPKRSPAERAASLVKAGRTALADLHNARLAARYAEWAHKLAPVDADVIALAIDALGKARRYHALERLLWLSLDGVADPKTSPALPALTALYEGGLRRPERARALTKLAG